MANKRPESNGEDDTLLPSVDGLGRGCNFVKIVLGGVIYVVGLVVYFLHEGGLAGAVYLLSLTLCPGARSSAGAFSPRDSGLSG